MKSWILIGIGAVVLLVGSLIVVKRVSPVGWGWWGKYNTSSGIALKGFDPVAYHESNKPTLGSSQYTYEWGGARWEFSSAHNRDLFAQVPEVYAPQFGGFCSFAVSKGFTADVSPDAWHIENGKLYLFSDKNFEKKWIEALGEGSLESSEMNWARRSKSSRQ